METRIETIRTGNAIFEGSPCFLVLTQDELSWFKSKTQKEKIGGIVLEDVIGTSINPKNRDIVFVHTCVFKQKSTIRERKTLIFVFEERKNASLWSTAIRATLAGVNVEDSVIPKKYGVFFNPHADPQSEEVFGEVVKPMLKISNILASVTYLNHPGHLKQLCKGLTSDFDVIMCIGGDELIQEAINGLMEREDWNIAILTPIAIIPSKKSCLLSEAIGGSDSVTATYLAIKGQPHKIDVFSVLQGSAVVQGASSVLKKTNRLYGILNISWGQEEDTENSGSFRFTLNVLKKAMGGQSKKNTGRLSLFPVDRWEKIKFDSPVKKEDVGKFGSKDAMSENALQWKKQAEISSEIVRKSIEQGNQEDNKQELDPKKKHRRRKV